MIIVKRLKRLPSKGLGYWRFFSTRCLLLKAVFCSGRYRRRVTLCSAVSLLFLTLHFYVLPKSMGYYNEECFLSETKKEDMRFVLRHMVNFLNEENVTYWLDFGTLLGVVRDGDIIAHDGDMDVSRLADDLEADRQLLNRFSGAMSNVGIKVDAFTAKYKGVQVDLFRWQTRNTSGEPRLYKYFPFIPKVTFGEVISDFLFPPEIPTHVLLPLKQIRVFGVLANIPRKTLRYLKIRYPLTWSLDFPYKWKCWV